MTVYEALMEYPDDRMALEQPEHFYHTCKEYANLIFSKQLLDIETSGWQSIGFPSSFIMTMKVIIDNIANWTTQPTLLMYKWHVPEHRM